MSSRTPMMARTRDDNSGSRRLFMGNPSASPSRARMCVEHAVAPRERLPQREDRCERRWPHI